MCRHHCIAIWFPLILSDHYKLQQINKNAIHNREVLALYGFLHS